MTESLYTRSALPEGVEDILNRAAASDSQGIFRVQPNAWLFYALPEDADDLSEQQDRAQLLRQRLSDYFRFRAGYTPDELSAYSYTTAEQVESDPAFDDALHDIPVVCVGISGSLVADPNMRLVVESLVGAATQSINRTLESAGDEMRLA